MIGGYHESVEHLSIKVYASILHANTCRTETGQDDFVVFTDDDVYIFIDHLENIIIDPLLQLYDFRKSSDKEPEELKNISSLQFIGNVHWADRPFRKKTDQYYIPFAEYPFGVFPPYCSGMTYLISPDAIPRLYEMTQKVPIPRHLDDVYVSYFYYH